MVAWENLYLPKYSGGWNVKNIDVWNKVAIGKLMWALAYKKDKLWVLWSDSFYMKGQDPLQCDVPNSCSMALKKIFSSRAIIQQIGGWSNSIASGKYSINKVYKSIQGDCPKVSYRRVICYNKTSPRSIFITWLAILNRLYTTNRIQSWGITCSDIFVLCSYGKESVEHLFFECAFSAVVWQVFLLHLGIHVRSDGFAHELETMVKKSRKTSSIAKLYVMCFTVTVYIMWLTRNGVVFKKYVK